MKMKISKETQETLSIWDLLPDEAEIKLPVVLVLLGIQRSKAYEMMDPTSKYHDPDFPPRIYDRQNTDQCDGDKTQRYSVKFKKGDIIRYLQLRETRLRGWSKVECSNAKARRNNPNIFDNSSHYQDTFALLFFALLIEAVLT